jgi:rhodanese-related sulfurtransferase
MAGPSRPIHAVTFAELAAFAGRNPVLSLAFVGLTVAIIANEIAGLLSGIKRIGPAQLTALVNRDNALVIDLRAAADFAKGHIAGSKNVQMSQFDPENKALAPAKALPVVLVCNVGQTAGVAAKRLRKAGFANVAVLEGGIRAWLGADLPVVKGR